MTIRCLRARPAMTLAASTLSVLFFTATALAGPCGPGNGPCDEPNGTPGCDDIECCEAVCAADPFCCDNQWDQICADVANTLCCNLVCDGTDEGEACGADTNGGCNSTPVTFGAISCGETVCGTGWADGGTRDTDWYIVETTAECTELNAELVAEFDAVTFIVDGINGCDPVIIGTTGSSNDCVAIAPANAQVGPGTYVVFVVPAVFEGAPCGGQNDYSVTLTCTDCVPPDPIVNDNCEDRVEIFEGATDYSTIGAETDGVPHLDCDFDGQTYQDIWYNYVATCTGTLTVSTCDTADYDTDLVVYSNCDVCPPGDDDLLGCNDDFTGCGGFTSTVIVDVVQGNCYKIRVGGWNDGDEGNGTLTISCEGVGCPCTWDLDGDCDVDAADLATLLANWGMPYDEVSLNALLVEWGCDG